MFSSSIIAKSSFKCRNITPHKLISTVQNHLGRIGAFRRETRGVDTLPVSKHWQRILILPAEMVPIRYVFTDTDDQLARVRLLQIDSPEEGVSRRAA